MTAISTGLARDMPVFVSAVNDYQRGHFNIFLNDEDVTQDCLEAHSRQGWVCSLVRVNDHVTLEPDLLAPKRRVRTGRVRIEPAYPGPYRAILEETYRVPIGNELHGLTSIQELIDEHFTRLIPAFTKGRRLWLWDYEPVSDVAGHSLYARYAHTAVRIRTSLTTAHSNEHLEVLCG